MKKMMVYGARIFCRAMFTLLAIALACGCASAWAGDSQDLPVWDMYADPAGIPEEFPMLQSEETTVTYIADEPEAKEAAGARYERVYIRVEDARFYASKPMDADTLAGTVTGVALALYYPENQEISWNEAIFAVFATGDGALHEGVFEAEDILVMDYADAMSEIGEDAFRWYAEDASWPLPMSVFTQAGSERPSHSVSLPNATPAPIPEEEFVWETETTPEPEFVWETEQTFIQEGSAYIQLYGARVYANEGLTSDSLLGRVFGIVLATAYNDGDAWAGQPTLAVTFHTTTGTLTGHVRAADAEALDYQRARAKILGDDDSNDAFELWPLPTPAFAPDDGQTEPLNEDEIAAEEEAAPCVVISQYFTGELIAGAQVELKAEVFNLAQNKIAGYRWKNNIGGEFQEVPGVTGNTCVFLANECNTGCEWIVEVLLF